MNTSIPQKPCQRCGLLFPLTPEHWHKNTSTKDGFTHVCKPCACAVSKEWRTNNPEKAKETSTAWREANKEQIAERKHARYLEHRDDILAHARVYYQENKPAHRERGRKWREENREKDNANARRRAANPEAKAKRSAYYKKYRLENPEKVSEKNRLWHESLSPDRKRSRRAARRAREIAAEGRYTAEDIGIAYRSQRGKCWHCFKQVGDNYHADHLVPLKHGGTNWPNNIVISCKRCNLKKGSKLCYQWNGRLF